MYSTEYSLALKSRLNKALLVQKVLIEEFIIHYRVELILSDYNGVLYVLSFILTMFHFNSLTMNTFTYTVSIFV